MPVILRKRKSDSETYGEKFISQKRKSDSNIPENNKKQKINNNVNKNTLDNDNTISLNNNITLNNDNNTLNNDDNISIKVLNFNLNELNNYMYFEKTLCKYLYLDVNLPHKPIDIINEFIINNRKILFKKNKSTLSLSFGFIPDESIKYNDLKDLDVIDTSINVNIGICELFANSHFSHFVNCVDNLNNKYVLNKRLYLSDIINMILSFVNKFKSNLNFQQKVIVSKELSKILNYSNNESSIIELFNDIDLYINRNNLINIFNKVYINNELEKIIFLKGSIPKKLFFNLIKYNFIPKSSINIKSIIEPTRYDTKVISDYYIRDYSLNTFNFDNSNHEDIIEGPFCKYNNDNTNLKYKKYYENNLENGVRLYFDNSVNNNLRKIVSICDNKKFGYEYYFDENQKLIYEAIYDDNYGYTNFKILN